MSSRSKSTKTRVVHKIAKSQRKPQPGDDVPNDALTPKAGPKLRKRRPIAVKPIPKLKDLAPAVSDSESDESESESDMLPLEKAAATKAGKKQRRLAKQKEAAAKSVQDMSPVVYLGRIPYGFFEEQMRGFFGQFGDLKRLRLSRNRKTGKSKHYAFLEFDSPDVARIVADTMDGYLLFGHKLVCHVIAKDNVHPALFKGANKKFVKVPWKKIERLRHNKDKEPEQAEKVADRLVKQETKKRQRIASLGIEYDFPGYAAQRQTRSKKIKFSD